MEAGKDETMNPQPGTTGQLNFPESGNRCLRVHLPWCNGVLDDDRFLCRAPTSLHEIQFFIGPLFITTLQTHPLQSTPSKNFLPNAPFKTAVCPTRLLLHVLSQLYSINYGERPAWAVESAKTQRGRRCR